MELQVEQLPDEGFAIEERGAVSVAYQLTVHNRRADAVTLREIRMQVLGSGPYTLRNEPASVSQTIEAGQEARITFTMWSYPRQHKSTTREAIWVSGAAQFESAQGAFQREFTLSFREP